MRKELLQAGSEVLELRQAIESLAGENEATPEGDNIEQMIDFKIKVNDALDKWTVQAQRLNGLAEEWKEVMEL